MLEQMNEEERSKMELDNYLKKKEQSTRDLNELIDKIKPVLGSTLLELSKSKFNEDPKKRADYELNMNINDRNIEEYLSDLEKYINILMAIRQENKIKGVSGLKDQSTNYSRPLPILNYEEIGKEKVEKEDNRFIDESRLREYAAEYWEKKKNKGKDL
jgi:hypothetical protein